MKEHIENEKVPFAKRHPILTYTIVLLFFLIAIFIASVTVILIAKGIGSAVEWIANIASRLDAVVLVALITGALSLISSIVAKIVDYKKQRQMYLAQKREKSYSAFIEMFYKIQQNSKKEEVYTDEEMLKDIRDFSQELTLWGSKKVANKWVEFRKNGASPELAKKNLFVLEEIMNEMRKDMGVQKTKQGLLLSFFVNDIESVMPKKRK